MIQVLTTFSILFALVSGQNFNLTKINQDAGILFEAIGEVKLYNTTWTFLTTLEKPNTTKFEKFLNDCLYKLDELCKVKSTNIYISENCYQIHKEFQQVHFELTQQISGLTHFFHTRTKRSYFDGAGNLLHTLIGTMDEKDSEKIYKRLQTLKGDNAKTLDLLSEQTTIIKSHINWTERNLNQLDEEQNRIINQLSNLDSKITNIQDETNLQSLQIRINEVMSLATLEITHIRSFLTAYTEILAQLANHKLHPRLLSLAQLIEHMKANILTQQHPDMIINKHLLTQILEVVPIYLEDKIIIKISVPIPDNEKFKAYKSYLLPQKVSQNTYSIYDIKDDIILTNLGGTKFITLTQENFNCKNVIIDLKHSISFCKDNYPKTMSSEGNCLTELFHDPSNRQLSNCAHKIVYTNANHITKMSNDNSWLVIVIGSLNIVYKCNNDEQKNILLNQSSILKINNPCIFKLEKYVLPYEYTKTKNISILQPNNYYKPEIDINLLDKITYNTIQNQTKINNVIHHTNKFFHEDSYNIENLQNKIDNEKRERQLRKQLEDQQFNNHIIQIITLLIIAIIVIILSLYYKIRKPKEQPLKVLVPEHTEIPLQAFSII